MHVEREIQPNRGETIMAKDKDIQNEQPDEEKKRESGVPGGGKGRKDEVGHSGVYPMSGPLPKGDAKLEDMGAWGQGEEGIAGYEEAGGSEIFYTKEELEDIKRRQAEEASEQAAKAGQKQPSGEAGKKGGEEGQQKRPRKTA
jgi:hypothetical protein